MPTDSSSLSSLFDVQDGLAFHKESTSSLQIYHTALFGCVDSTAARIPEQVVVVLQRIWLSIF